MLFVSYNCPLGFVTVMSNANYEDIVDILLSSPKQSNKYIGRSSYLTIC